jgi:hypothetical protein
MFPDESKSLFTSEEWSEIEEQFERCRKVNALRPEIDRIQDERDTRQAKEYEEEKQMIRDSRTAEENAKLDRENQEQMIRVHNVWKQAKRNTKARGTITYEAWLIEEREREARENENRESYS